MSAADAKFAQKMFVHPRPKKSLVPPPSKRRKTNSAIDEISFDFDARADYLTGFHKRKLLRIKQAQEEAAKKAREEKIAERKQLRDERRKELEEHVNSLNALLKSATANGLEDIEQSEDEGWDGIVDEAPVRLLDHEEEYIDEDRYTTVTVEAVDVSKEGLHKISQEDSQSSDGDSKNIKTAGKAASSTEDSSTKTTWPRKTRKKKFRYESKIERKITRGKQRAGNKAKADARRGSG